MGSGFPSGGLGESPSNSQAVDHGPHHSNMTFSSTRYNHNDLLRLRGPLIAASVMTTLIWPFLQQISPVTAVKWLGLVVAVMISVHDLAFIIRRQAQRWANKIVLDQVLQFIFDPETGILAVAVATFMGNAILYSWSTEVDQRAKMLQSVLGSSHRTASTETNQLATSGNCDKDLPIPLDEAKEILLNPGGWTRLLPCSLQTWLCRNESDVSAERETIGLVQFDGIEQMDNTAKTIQGLEPMVRREGEQHSADSSMMRGPNMPPNSAESSEPENCLNSTSYILSSPYLHNPSIMQPEEAKNEAAFGSCVQRSGQNAHQEATTPPKSPIEILVTIILDTIKRRFEHHVRNDLPSVETLAVVTLLAMTASIGLNMRSKQKFLRSLVSLRKATWSAMTITSSIAMVGSVVALIAKTRTSADLCYRPALLIQRVFVQYRRHQTDKRWSIRFKGFLTFIILALIRKFKHGYRIDPEFDEGRKLH